VENKLIPIHHRCVCSGGMRRKRMLLNYERISFSSSNILRHCAAGRQKSFYENLMDEEIKKFNGRCLVMMSRFKFKNHYSWLTSKGLRNSNFSKK
jgi:hypothetical protein